MGVISTSTLPFLPETHVFSTLFKLLQANSTLFKHLWLVTWPGKFPETVPGRQWLPAFQESGTFSVFIPVSSVSRQKSLLPHGFGRQVPMAAGETFFRVHGSWRACPAGLFRTGASSACSGDGCFAGGGERAWRLNKKRRRRCACAVSGDGSDRRKKRFFCRRVFV